MAKFLQILAASVGGGLVLGASIRLGEAITAQGREGGRTRRPRFDSRTEDELSQRLDRLEREVHAGRSMLYENHPDEDEPEWQTALAGIVERIDRQQDDMDSMRRQISGAARAAGSVEGLAGDLHRDLHRQLSEDLDRRLASVEQSLHLSLEAANRKTVNAMVESIEKKLAPRIERLETEISGQSASVAELRECALQSERSILRLLTVLEKSVGPRRPGESDQGDAGDPNRRLSVVR